LRISESSLGMESAERRTFEVKTRMCKESYVLGDLNECSGANSMFESKLRREGIDPEQVKKDSKDKKSSDENAGDEMSMENTESGLSDSFFAWKKGISTGRTLKVNDSREAYEDMLEKIRTSFIQMLMRIFYPDKVMEMENTSGSRGISLLSDHSGNDDFSENQNVSYVLSKTVVQYTESSSESVEFQSKGSVKTEDGREIDFNISFAMSREFAQTISISEETIREVANYTDPLVINFGNSVTEIADQSFYFDIDNDGEKDFIRQLTEGSGYLTLDRNEDGQVNDGSELFGSRTGDGFAELAEYDEDGNGWIDENDDVFSRLKIWCRSATGDNILYTQGSRRRSDMS